jgi:hypothetical protein
MRGANSENRVANLAVMQEHATLEWRFGIREVQLRYRRRVLTSIFATTTIFSVIASADAQSPTAPPSERSNALQSYLISAVKSMLNPTTSLSTKDINFQISPHAVVTPNFASRDKAFANMLSSYDGVPDPKGNLPKAGSKSIKELLAQFQDSVEIGQRPVSEEQKADLSEAKNTLYKNVDKKTPTPKYTKYLKYRADMETATTQLAAADPASRPALLVKIQQLDSDWSVFGSREEIDAALAVLDASGQTNSQTSYQSWKVMVADGKVTDAAKFLNGLYRSSWLRASFASDKLSSLNVALVNLESGKKIEINLSRIAFDYAIIDIDRLELNHQFLSDTTWRTKSGFVLSDGNDAADTPSEVLPRYVSSLIVVKNLELFLTNDLDAGRMKELVAGNSAEISGIPFLAGGEAAVLQTKFIEIAAPVVIGYGWKALDKIPNTEPGLIWAQP